MEELKEKVLKTYNVPAKKKFSEQEIDTLVNILVAFKDDYEKRLIEIYNIDYILNIIDKDKVKEIEAKFLTYGDKGADIIDFVRIMLMSIEHKE